MSRGIKLFLLAPPLLSWSLRLCEGKQEEAGKSRRQGRAEPRRRFTSLIGWGGSPTGSAGLSGSSCSAWEGFESVGVAVWVGSGHTSSGAVFSGATVWGLVASKGTVWGALEDSWASLTGGSVLSRTWACGVGVRIVSGGKVEVCGGLVWSEGGLFESLVLSPGCCLASCWSDSRYACSCCRRLWSRSALRCSSSSRHLNS